MSKNLKLKIITQKKVVMEGLEHQVTVPTTEGEITILSGHIPLIAGLASGDIVAMSHGEYTPIAVTGGFVEVKNEDGVTVVAILADYAEPVSELTEEKVAQAKMLAAELKKKAENNEIVDFEHFEAELARSLNRIKIADKWKTRKYRK